MKLIRGSIVLALIGLAACGPTNFTATRCLSNVDCKASESCLTFRDGETYSSFTKTLRPGIRDGLCVRDSE